MSDYPMLISNKLHSFRNFAKEYYKNRQLKCVKKIQNVYGYKILTVTELYDESGKPLPIPSGTF